MAKKNIWRISLCLTAVLALLLLASCTSKPSVDRSGLGQMTLFKDVGCGCCGAYAQYAQSEGADVSVQDVSDVSQVKDDMGVPEKMRSCHTVQVGEYFVEGHIPLEAVEKLMSERPDIKGIALPGMPSGSPGMPGQKKGAWVIYAVNKDGSTQEFMRI